VSLRDLCPTVYGPVQSRRHGLSLGINLGDPGAKACTWSCIYCQCGFGNRVETMGGGFIPSVDQVLSGLKAAIEQQPAIDSVTIAGNSEPTSHPLFAEVVDAVLDFRKASGGRWIFNSLSNGSGLDDRKVVNACNRLDEIWIKFDCATDELFRRLNRPAARVGTVAEHLNRIKQLEKPRIQSLFWLFPDRPEMSNWTDKNREAVLTAYRAIVPEQVFITTIKREPAMRGLEPVPLEELESFGDRARAAGSDVKVFI